MWGNFAYKNYKGLTKFTLLAWKIKLLQFSLAFPLFYVIICLKSYITDFYQFQSIFTND